MKAGEEFGHDGYDAFALTEDAYFESLKLLLATDNRVSRHLSVDPPTRQLDLMAAAAKRLVGILRQFRQADRLEAAYHLIFGIFHAAYAWPEARELTREFRVYVAGHNEH